MCSCLCMHVCAQHVEARGWHWVLSSVALNLAFWDMIHRWTWSSAICACWLASEFWGSMCPCFPNAGIVDLCYDLYIGRGTEHSSPFLYGNSFTDGAISPMSLPQSPWSLPCQFSLFDLVDLTDPKFLLDFWETLSPDTRHCLWIIETWRK